MIYRHVVRINPSHVEAHTRRLCLIIGKDNADLLAHPPARHHATCQVCHHLQIVLCPRRNTVGPKSEFLGSTTSQANSDTSHQRLTTVVVAVFLSRKLRHTQTLTAR